MHDANDLGASYYERGDWGNAIRAFRQALEENPDDPDILSNLRKAEAKAREASARAEESRRIAEARAREEANRRAAEAQAREEANRRTIEAQAREEVSRRAVAEEANRRAGEAQARAGGKGRPSRAIEEAQSAAAHGRQAAATTDREEARRVFETTGDRVSGSGDVVDARNLPGRRVQIPPSLANRPEIREFQAQRAALTGQLQGLEQQLQTIRQQKERGEGNRGQLEVQEAATKQKISNVSSQIAVVDYKTESFVINMTREAAPSPAAQAAPR